MVLIVELGRLALVTEALTHRLRVNRHDVVINLIFSDTFVHDLTVAWHLESCLLEFGVAVIC